MTSALDDNWPYEQWQVVTNVLEREQVSQVFTQDIGLTYGFRLQGLPTDLRQALCEVQGLRVAGFHLLANSGTLWMQTPGRLWPKTGGKVWGEK